MTTRGEINSNFYQIVNVDANGAPTTIKPEYLPNVSNVANANYANYAGNAFSVNASNIVGTVNLANFASVANSVNGANVSGIVSNAAFATDTSHATVSDLANSVAVGNVTGIGNISTINLNGNGNSVLAGNGSWVAQTGGGNTANANYANFAGTAFSVSASNITGTINLANFATVANSVSGANVTGTVGNATHATVSDSANSVSAANISGTVNLANYATVANSVSGSNVSGTVANATYATNAGTATTAGTATNATNATYAVTAGSVAVANVTGIGNIATINLDGNTNHVLYGNGVFANLPTTIATANFANYAGNVTVASQPNITSLGNLTSLTLNNTVTPITANVGQMFWDTNEHTITIGMENGVQQQIGLEEYVYVKASSTITDGQAVMFTGANGDNVLAAPANVSSVGFKPEYIIGIATQSIATNQFGYITTVGKVHGLNTNSFNVGDILWVDTTTPGALTNVQPTDPIGQIQVAAVTKKSAGDGHIQVRVTPFYPLNRITDVNTTSPVSGQALVFDGGNVWINGNPNVANYAGVVTSNSQPNITSLGTLTGLNVTGNVAVNGNVTISGNLNYSNVTDLVVGDPLIYIGANNTGDTYDLGLVASYSDGNYYHTGIARNHSTNTWTFFDGVTAEPTTIIDWANATYPTVQTGNLYSNVVNGNLFVGNGSSLTSITGANVTGYVSNATLANYASVANNVAVGNVVGLGNIATTNLNGNTLNWLRGDGTWANINFTVVANANAANTILSNSATIGSYSILAASNSANGYSSSLKSSGVRVDFSSNTVIATSFDGDLVAGGTPTTLVHVGSGSILSNISGTTISTVTSSNVTFSKPILINGSVTANTFVSNVATGTAPFTVTSTTTVANLSVANATFATSAGSATTATIAGTVTTNAQPNITSVGTLTSVNSSGTVTASRLVSNIATGTAPFTVTSTTQVANLNVANAGYATNAGNATVAASANSVAVANVTGIGNIATINLDGDSNHVLYGNGVWANIAGGSGANANYANFAGTAFSVDAGNIVGTVNLANYATVANSVAGANVSGAVSYATTANSVAGANVSGEVNYAAIANSVSVGNVSGLGNIATINLDGNVSNVLSGNGSFVSLPTVSANANYANFAGNAFSVDAGNIVGTVNLANYATVANSVAVANVSGIGNIATVNLDGNSSNVLYGNGVFAAGGGGGGGTPGGSNTQVQFNDGGSFGGNANLTFNKTTGLLTTQGISFKNIVQPPYSLGTTGGTIAPDVNNGSVQTITLNSALTMNGFTNPIAGQSLTLIIYGGAAYTSITSTMRFSQGNKALSAFAGCTDILYVYYDGTSYFASISRNYS